MNKLTTISLLTRANTDLIQSKLAVRALSNDLYIRKDDAKIKTKMLKLSLLTSLMHDAELLLTELIEDETK